MDVSQQLTHAHTEVARYAIRVLDSLELPNNPVIVFDIDATLLDHNNQVIKPIRTIYHYARMLGIIAVVITSRAGIPEVIDITKQQLTDVGITDITYFYFRSPRSHNHWSFKRNARFNLHERGYNVVMSVGDQDWDMTGEYAGFGIKVPIINASGVAYAFSPLPIVESHFLPEREASPSDQPSSF